MKWSISWHFLVPRGEARRSRYEYSKQTKHVLLYLGFERIVLREREKKKRNEEAKLT
jgi:hypothetical protein